MNLRKKKKDNNETDRQLLQLSNGIDKLKTKVKQLENAIAMTDDEAFECMHLAPKRNLTCHMLLKGMAWNVRVSSLKPALQRYRNK